jgi:hypothetical protein
MRKVGFCRNKAEMVKRFRNLFSLVVISVLLMACALGTDRVKLHDPLTYKPAEGGGTKVAYADVPGVKTITGEKIRMIIKKVEDRRPDTSRIGAKKNTYGMKMGSIDLEEGVVFLEVFKKNLSNCFELAGYEIIPDKEKGKGFVEAEIGTFWVTFIPGFARVDAKSLVTFSVRLFEPEANKEVWSGMFDGSGMVSSGLAVTRGMYEESINRAYAEAMRKFYTAISDEKVKDLLTK